MEPTKWLSVAQSAEHAGVSTDTIYTAVARKEIRHTRIGGRRVIKIQADWVDEWMGRAMVAPRVNAKETADGTLQAV